MVISSKDNLGCNLEVSYKFNSELERYDLYLVYPTYLHINGCSLPITSYITNICVNLDSNTELAIFQLSENILNKGVQLLGGTKIIPFSSAFEFSLTNLDNNIKNIEPKTSSDTPLLLGSIYSISKKK